MVKVSWWHFRERQDKGKILYTCHEPIWSMVKVLGGGGGGRRMTYKILIVAEIYSFLFRNVITFVHIKYKCIGIVSIRFDWKRDIMAKF